MSPLRTLAFALPALPLAFAALPVYVQVPALYAQVTGLSLGTLGLVLMFARLADALIDPWLGAWADRCSRRRLMGWALWPLALGFAMLLNPPASAGVPWLLTALLLTYLGYSGATVTHLAWGAALGSRHQNLPRLTAMREGLGLAGVVLAAALPTLWSDRPAQGAQVLSWLLPTLLCLAWYTLTWGVSIPTGTPEPLAAVLPPPPERPPVHTQKTPSALSTVGSDPVLRRLLTVFLVNGIASAIPATLFLFFVADVLQAPTWGGPLLVLYFLCGAASLPGWLWVADRIGRARAWAASMALAWLAFSGAAALGPGDGWAFAGVCAASGLALGADLSLPATLAGARGARIGHPGATFGVWNLISKLNLALAAGLALPALALAGYRPGLSWAATALTWAYAGLPLLFKSVAAFLLWRWRFILEDPP